MRDRQSHGDWRAEYEHQARYGSPLPPAPRPSPSTNSPLAPVPHLVVQRKLPGLSWLFSFLWLGTGNLYAGQVALGLCFLLAQLLFVPLAFLLLLVTSGFGMVVTVPIWGVAYVVSAAVGDAGRRTYNRRRGLPG